MSYFKHVQLHKYDLTDKGISQACYDELVAELGDAWVHLTDKQLRVLSQIMNVRSSRTGCDLSSRRGGHMDTGLYRDIVYTEYMLEHDLTWQEMTEKNHTDEMLKRVAHMEWQDEQRAYTVDEWRDTTVHSPDDCPF